MPNPASTLGLTTISDPNPNNSDDHQLTIQNMTGNSGADPRSGILFQLNRTSWIINVDLQQRLNIYSSVPEPTIILHAEVNSAGRFTDKFGFLAPVASIVVNAAPKGVPTGWLLCDGSPIDPKYTDLISLVGSSTPNLTGKAPVGAYIIKC